MPSWRAEAPVVTGLGVACGFGYGKQALLEGLYSGADAFGVLARPGRQAPGLAPDFIGVELPEPPALLPPRVARTASLSARVAIAVLDEAWQEAGLDALAPERIGLVVGGANLQSREQLLAQQAYAERLEFLPPRHGYGFFDSDLTGLCASHFPIRGFAHSVGGASASGALAVVQAARAVRAGLVDACIALGVLQDLSCFDLLGLRAMGAMGSHRFAAAPGQACRPFDRDRDGFIYGEACAALVIRRAGTAPAYGAISGAALVANGNRGPDPSLAGELRAIRQALAQAGLEPGQIDYVNGHATSTPLGDDTELAAYREAGLSGAWINASKASLGHGLSAAGALELAAVLLQMREGRLHPTRNLEQPVDPELKFVRGEPLEQRVAHALKLSFGFGGTDTAIVISASS